jgi:DNA-binding Xre family transcriptional regulator
MAVSYNKLFTLMIDKKMRKGELCKAAGISHSVLRKIAKDENVQVDVLDKICGTLNCGFGDIMDYIPDNDGETDTNGGAL